MRFNKRPAAEGAVVTGPGEDAEAFGEPRLTSGKNRRRFTDECVGHGRSGIHRLKPG